MAVIPLHVRVAARAGALLRDRGETIAVAESSAGGLIAAALLAVPGASSYFVGGASVYTTLAKQELVGLSAADLALARAATETHALALARSVRRRLATTWGLGETGAAGPTGNRYGDPAGHCCLAVAGPVEGSLTVETGEDDRWTNMEAFAEAALRLLIDVLERQ
jgi:nicotinamide-nucleotide amidase